MRGHDADKDPPDDIAFAESGWSKIGETGIHAIGFRDELILGIDGAGYDFFEAHWEPLYDALNYRWHESSTNSRLAAAAPKLLDACEQALEKLEAWRTACGPLEEGDNTETVIAELKSAICAAKTDIETETSE